jgi:hypothetical protein
MNEPPSEASRVLLALGDEYKLVEKEFLALVRSRAERLHLAEAAEAVAVAAHAWNLEAYRQYRRPSSGEAQESLDWLTERTEVLSGLWVDLAAAYHA